MIESKVVICDCDSTSHQVRIHFVSGYEVGDEWIGPEEMYIETNLNPDRSIWNRIITGLKYIFGIQERNGQFCCVCLNKEKVLEFKEVVDNFLLDYQSNK
jgi:hypothetical protein